MGSSKFIDAACAQWGFLVSGIILCYLVVSIIHGLFLSPLARYPGPFLAKISSWPSFYHAVKGDRHVWLWQCFQIYGSKIRVSPDGVVFNSPKAYSDIYSHKANVKKSKTYSAWQRREQDENTLSTTDVALHAKKRRLLNTVFTKDSLNSAESFILKHVDHWNELTLPKDDREWSKPIDMTDWTDCLVFDILGDLCFGKSFRIKEPRENPLKIIPHAIVKYMRFYYPLTRSPFLDTIVWLKPRGLNILLENITPKIIKRYYDFVETSVKERTEMEKSMHRSGLDSRKERKDMFHYLFQAKDPENGGPAFSPQDLLAEANLLIIAGSDTTSISICGLFFYITHYPRVYRKLVSEIRNTFQSVHQISSGPRLTSCQYLRACIDEAMRMTPAGPCELSRTVLAGGTWIDGDFFPEGVKVGMAGWTNGRREETYGDPNLYRPERWIVDERSGTTEEDVARIRACFHPFSAGPGNCVGQNLAMLEMMLMVARTLYRMDVRLAPESTLGEGGPAYGWGRRDRNQYQLIDAYISVREGPMVQFKEHQN